MYKVPFRMCYAETLWGWVKYSLWCHVALKLWPNASDPGGSPEPKRG